MRTHPARGGRRATAVHRASLVMLLATLCGACFPVYKTRRPEAILAVRDTASRPLAGARVILVTSRYPYGREFARDTLLSDSAGVVRFARRRAWEMETLMIHGAWVYAWHWCVEAPGHDAFDSRRASGRFQPRTELRLGAGTAERCTAR
ncbi:MAG: hypothetical protein IT355_08270 [Gemmatimonadaceae bacterium]|nr:hypothetical protein [Gemmatimonadaceae bacterium]